MNKNPIFSGSGKWKAFGITVNGKKTKRIFPSYLYYLREITNTLIQWTEITKPRSYWMPKFQIAFLVCQPSLNYVGLNHTGPLTCEFFLINRNSIKLSAGWICRCSVTKIEGTGYGARVSSEFWHRKGLWAQLRR